MNPMIQCKPTILPLLMAGALACFGLLSKAEAVVPAPDGGYPGFNTAEGQNALFSLTTGGANTAVGWFSLFSDTEGSFNTATGAGALLFNTADENTAFGAAALLFNTTGVNNTAVGAAALVNNTTGRVNTAVGCAALRENTDGIFNTAVGTNALSGNSSGQVNTAIGALALSDNDTGTNNTAIGSSALQTNIGGDSNTAIGQSALFSSTGHSNTALGINAGVSVTTANNVICIGHTGQNVSNSCFIGHIYSNVQPQVGTDPDLVTINSDGRLGRANVSSRRYKHDIHPIHKASEVIYALKPVSFRYHKQYDATQTLAFGLIAEEVAEVYPDLVGRNPQGKPESVRYEQINAMLLNEFLKEHRKNEEQQATIARQQKQIEALAAGLQKVNARLAAASPSLADLK